MKTLKRFLNYIIYFIQNIVFIINANRMINKQVLQTIFFMSTIFMWVIFVVAYDKESMYHEFLSYPYEVQKMKYLQPIVVNIGGLNAMICSNATYMIPKIIF